jgi:hypothetical protein
VCRRRRRRRRRSMMLLPLQTPELFNQLWEQSADGVIRLILDQGLTWKKQLEIIANRVYRAFCTCMGTETKGATLDIRDISTK